MGTTTLQTNREASVMSLVPKSSVGGASISAIGAVSNNEVIALAGFGVAVLSFLVNLLFQFRKDRREAALNAAQIAALSSSKE